jgi:hypothetical protein
MTPRTTVIIFISAGLLACAALLLAQSGGTLSAGRARDLIRRLGGAELEKDRVRIKSVTPGTGGGAIVEAQIDATFRVTREGDEWRVKEMRLGDRQWESIELIAEAIEREKARRTTALLEQVAAALESYRRARGHYVVAEDAGVLVDHLSPNHLRTPVRFDLWGASLIYRGTASNYRLASAGPDRKPETNDDLVVENGKLRGASGASAP